MQARPVYSLTLKAQERRADRREHVRLQSRAGLSTGGEPGPPGAEPRDGMLSTFAIDRCPFYLPAPGESRRKDRAFAGSSGYHRDPEKPSEEEQC